MPRYFEFDLNYIQRLGLPVDWGAIVLLKVAVRETEVAASQKGLRWAQCGQWGWVLGGQHPMD